MSTPSDAPYKLKQRALAALARAAHGPRAPVVWVPAKSHLGIFGGAVSWERSVAALERELATRKRRLA